MKQTPLPPSPSRRHRKSGALDAADAHPGQITLAPLLPSEQQAALQVALVWWQEGERSLEYLAELGQHEAILTRLQPLFAALRGDSTPTSASIAPLLRLVRGLFPHSALNRTLETDTFACALRAFLFGNDPLPQRLSFFLDTQYIGPQTASLLLFAAVPEQFALVTPATRAFLAAPRQRTAARKHAAERYGLVDTTVSSEAIALLADFEIHEASRQVVRPAASFAEVYAVLKHAREMPVAARRRKRAETRGAQNASTPAHVVREASWGYEIGGDSVIPPPPTEADLVAVVEAHIAARGFAYPPLAVRDYYIALKTKPFVILTGLSGTGKTRLTHLFAEALSGGGGLQDQYLLLPVRPDWTDSTALLGYHNIVADRYASTPFLDLLTRANQPESRERAFFVCLDEMNLARVEHYLSDLLSVMESPPPRRLILDEGRTVGLPDNVFLTGSVNVDEATYPFSRKVLDRANTIEFSTVSLALSEEGQIPRRQAASPEIAVRERQRLFLAGRVLSVGAARERLDSLDSAFVPQTIANLTELNNLLETRGMHFGYRIRDEVLRYIAASFTREKIGLLHPEDPAQNLLTALDLQLVQKVLPRLTGTDESLGDLLKRVEEWMTAHDFFRAAAKLARMRRRAAEEGVVSFYEL